MPTSFPTHAGGGDPDEDGRGPGGVEHARVDHDPGVGQGEQWKDHEGRDRSRPTLQPFGRVSPASDPTARDQHAGDHAGQGGLHSPGSQEHPDGHPADQHGPGRQAGPAPGHHHDQRDQQGPEQGRGMGAGRIEDGQDQDRADVVGHGQGQQQEPKSGRHPAPQQGQCPECEGDVGGHGDPPAGRPRAPVIAQGVDQSGAGHAAGRPDHRDHRGAEVAQLPGAVLPADLQAHHEEEHRHQSAVHPRLHGGELGEGRAAHVNGMAPHRGVGRAPRAVGP